MSVSVSVSVSGRLVQHDGVQAGIALLSLLYPFIFFVGLEREW